MFCMVKLIILPWNLGDFSLFYGIVLRFKTVFFQKVNFFVTLKMGKPKKVHICGRLIPVSAYLWPF